MGSKLAFPLAQPVGGVTINNLRARPLGGNQWLVEWTPFSVAYVSAFMIYVDGRLFDMKIDETSIIIEGEENADPIVQVIQIAAQWGDPGYSRDDYFDAIQPNRIKVTWNPPASVTDVVKYRIYWDDAGGTVIFDTVHLIGEVSEDGLSSYEFFTVQLAADTYKFVVRTVDQAGNESTNTAAFTQVITTYPGIVASPTITYDSGTGKVTLTWIDPADIGAGNVRVYDNAGAANLFPNYSTPSATVGAGVQTHLTPVLADGTWVFGLRVFNGTLEELNSTVWLIVRIASSLEVSGPPSKPILLAQTAAAGKINLSGVADQITAFGITDAIQFFTNDGAGGAVDFGTIIGTVSVSPIGAELQADFTTITYGETARIFAARAVTSGGVISVNSDEVTITPDATIPPIPLSIATDTGRD